MDDNSKYISDLAAIRSMMQRSSKFLSLSGWSGVMAGIYALVGVYVADKVYLRGGGFITHPSQLTSEYDEGGVAALALMVLFLSVITAVALSYRNAKRRQEKFFNAIAKQVVVQMSVPLVTGAIVIFISYEKGMFDFITPFMLIFYGLALFNTSKFTYEEVQSLGIIQIVLGIISLWQPRYGLICWATGFGIFHIIYGIYMHYKYER